LFFGGKFFLFCGFFFFGNKHVSSTVKFASSSKKNPILLNLKFGKRKKRKKAQSVGFFFFANSRRFQDSYKVFCDKKYINVPNLPDFKDFFNN
jgi:hypothetical protein